MSTGYKYNGVDIDELFETFTVEEQNQYNILENVFSGESSKYKVNGKSVKESRGIIFPTVSYSWGGGNWNHKYSQDGSIIEFPLKGERPVGMPVASLVPGTYYVNRINGETWVSENPNEASGIRLSHNPKYLIIELQGGGGGGAGSSSLQASSGGAAGGYCLAGQVIPENSYLKIIVGAGGEASKGVSVNPSDASPGEDSAVYEENGYLRMIATGGGGGIGSENGDAQSNGGTGTIYSDNDGVSNRLRISGGYGGKKNNSGGNVGEYSTELLTPERPTWVKGGYTGGASGGIQFGGGGGASVFANGGSASVKAASGTDEQSGHFGSGGAGAGMKFLGADGGRGGDGLCNLYY